MIRTHHRRAGIRRTPARPTVVEHRLAEQVDVLPLDLDRHRTGGDELRRPMRIGRDQAAPGPLAGHVADAFERRAPDRHGVAFDLDRRRVALGREFRLGDVGQRRGHKRSRRTGHLADVGRVALAIGDCL